MEPISFSVGGRPGVNMGDALRKACVGLDGQGDPVLQDSGGAISCRFLVGLSLVLSKTFRLDVIQSSLGTQPTVVRARYDRCISCAVTY